MSGGASNGPGPGEIPDLETAITEDTSVDVLTISHFNENRIGFAIDEPSAGVDADYLVKFQQGVTALQGDHFAVAIEIFQEIIAAYPDYANPHIDIALAYRHLGMLEEAKSHLLMAISLVPDHPVASNEYALILKSEGQFKEARKIFEQAAESFPEYAQLHRNLGILCDVYFNDRLCAQKSFEYCQYLSGGTDEEIAMWLSELQHRPQ